MLLESVCGDQHKIGGLQETLMSAQADRKAWQDRAGKLEKELSQQHEAQQKVEADKEALLGERTTLKESVASLQAQVGVQRAELEAGLHREKTMAKEMEQLIEVLSGCGLGGVLFLTSCFRCVAVLRA